jgi:DNA-binding HxlR family transcriptional regulator
MLSKELQDLETNELVSRSIVNTKPISVEYEITEYGKTLENVLKELANWGIEHRKRLLLKETK